jgi:protein-tyrosine phosphatase
VSPGALSLGLEKATNARDLGGLVAADGRRVRSGLLFRANALNRLTEADVTVLGGLGLACLIDFRHPHEIELIGPDRLPPVRPRRVVSLPLFDPDHDVFTTVSAALTGRSGEASVDRLRDGGAEAVMRELYRWFVEASLARQAFGAALRIIADDEALPLLFHCTAGKDRTGWLAALVLSALGVERHVVTADYLRTNELNAPGTAFVLAALAGRVDDPAVLLPVLEARPVYLDEAFDAALRRYGGVDGYLTAGLGLDAAWRERLRGRLLE